MVPFMKKSLNIETSKNLDTLVKNFRSPFTRDPEKIKQTFYNIEKILNKFESKLPTNTIQDYTKIKEIILNKVFHQFDEFIKPDSDLTRTIHIMLITYTQDLYEQNIINQETFKTIHKTALKLYDLKQKQANTN